MITVEIGNTVAIEWRVTRNGAPEDFGGKSLSLFIVGPYARLQVNTFTVEGNILRFSFFGAEQKHVGKYGFELIENDGKGNMSTLRLCDALCLARCSCGSVDVITLDSEITLPANGLSAYEIAVKEGFVGTEEEWIESLKQPAIDAAARADAAAKAANEAADSANKAATSANSAADKATAAATAANDAAAKAEDAGGDAAAAAKAANAAAVSANAAAQAATTAASSANAAAEGASLAAGKADTAAKNADLAAGSANTAAKNAQAATNAANTAADAADKAAKDAQTATEAANAAAKAANDAAKAANDALATIEKKIADAVAVETDRAKTVEEGLDDRLVIVEMKQVEDGDKLDALDKEMGQVQGDIILEVNRATNAEGKLSQHIDALFEVSPTEPQNPNTAAWVNPEGDVVEVCPEAPEDGKSYVRKDGAWYDAVPEGGYMRGLYESMPNVVWNAATKMYDVWKDKGGISVTENEMSEIYNSSIGADSYEFSYIGSPKCVIPRFNLYALNKILLISVLQSNSARFLAVSPSQNTGKTKVFSISTIFDSSRLKVIYNSIYCNKSCNYVGLGGIEIINLVIDKVSAFTINLKNAIKISYDSWRYIPDNVIGDTYSNTTTISVNSIPYSLLTGTATDEQYTATGHTKAEWIQVVSDSSAKGITFTQALQRAAAFARAMPEPTRIEGAEIVAGTDKALKRPGINGYFQRATLLDGETVESFEEVPLQVAIDYEIEQEKKQEDERSNILGARPEDR